MGVPLGAQDSVGEASGGLDAVPVGLHCRAADLLAFTQALVCVGEASSRASQSSKARSSGLSRPAAAWVSGVRAGFRTPRILSVSQRSQPLHRVPFGPAVGEGDMAELGVRRSIVAVPLEQAASAAMPLIGGGVRQDRP